MITVSKNASGIAVYVQKSLVRFFSTTLKAANDTNLIVSTADGHATVYEVLEYNRSLTEQDVAAIYNDPLNPPTTGLVLEYLPSGVDPANNVWKDLSGNGNDGTISGATYVALRPISEALSGSAYELDFNGVNSYAESPKLALANNSEVTICMIAHSKDTRNRVALEFGAFNSHGTYWMINNDTWGITGAESGVQKTLYIHVIRKSEVQMLCAVYTTTATIAYVDGQKVGTLDRGFSVNWSPEALEIGTYRSLSSWAWNGTAYFTLLYSRALNSSEIAQIYEHPLNPPTSGLVLFYSPYSYDPSSGKWLNIAPIFPTIPLSEELDATNHNATPVRISIPNLTVYDAQTKSKIPPEDLNVSMLLNNSTIGLVPSLLTLPANGATTLNISATNHLPKLLTISLPVNSIGVYLQFHVGGSGVVDKDFNAFQFWPGGGIGAKIMHLDVRDALIDFFSNQYVPLLGIIVALLIWSVGVIMAWSYSNEPEVPIIWGLILYEGLKEFVALNQYFVLFDKVIVPFAFITTMLYLKKILDAFGGE